MKTETRSYLLERSDIKLLQLLLGDARATLAELAEVANLSISQAQRRVKRLEELGVIAGYRTVVDHELLGLGVVAFTDIVLGNQDTGAAQRFHEAIRQVPEVVECYRVSGDADYLGKVYAPDLKSYSRIAQESILSIPEVERITTKIVFEAAKDTAQLPVSYLKPHR